VVAATAEGAEVTGQRFADNDAQAAQRRADTAGENTERNRRHLRDLSPDGEVGSDDVRSWDAATAGRDGTAEARDQAARMHDSAASMHDRAVHLGIGDSDEHRRSAARHRQAAVSHRPPAPDGEQG
jgi:hypothetical protein